MTTSVRSKDGFCDFLRKDHQIRVHGRTKQPVGQATVIFEPRGYECQFASMCRREHDCPIWKQLLEHR